MDHSKYFQSIVDFYYNNPNQYMSFIDILIHVVTTNTCTTTHILQHQCITSLYVYVGANTYFFLMPFTQRLVSSGQNQNSYSTLLVERKSFLSLSYLGAGVSYLLLPTLALHIVPVMACNAQHHLPELGQHFTILTIIHITSHCCLIFHTFNMVKHNCEPLKPLTG